MSTQMEKKPAARPVNMERLLRLKTKLDLIFNADLFQNQTDVRGTVLLGMNSKMIAVAQTSPPILKSMINKEIEASFVHRDLVNMERTRWGWDSRILGLDNEYIPEDREPDTPPTPAVFIAPPGSGRNALRSTNVRLDYRLAVNAQDKVHVKINPSLQGAKLVNFSAGGAMIEAPGAPQAQSGAQVHVNIVFPWPDKDSKTSIKSLAEVVRVDYVSGDKVTRLGLHFLEMEMETHRNLGKIINHYMLAEQRLRNTRF